MREEIPAVKKVKKSVSVTHHLDRRCVVGHGCSYEGPSLKRYMGNVHILHNQVDKYFATGLQGHKKRGPREKSKAAKK